MFSIRVISVFTRTLLQNGVPYVTHVSVWRRFIEIRKENFLRKWVSLKFIIKNKAKIAVGIVLVLISALFFGIKKEDGYYCGNRVMFYFGGKELSSHRNKLLKTLSKQAVKILR